ncbi:MAG: cation transporter [Lachnospiraceae bacterium]|nr:cation transporter [Lachnospiraceae bacterium]
MNRTNQIILTGVVGIIVNIILAGFKYAVGILTHSVSINADAVNNFSDALSSLITIIGTKLAAKEPDKKHPFGYGRLENISTLFIALLILFAGFSALRESIRTFFSSEPPEHSHVTLIIVGVALAAKFLLALFTKTRGKKLDSSSLEASGQDAFNDCLLSASTIVSALIYMEFNVNIEVIIGIVISLFIIKSGIEVLRETVSGILGERVSAELSLEVKKIINEFPDVISANDLIINSYGNDKLLGSVHITVPDVMRAAWIDNLERQITDKVYEETGVILTGISVYSVNTSDEFAVSALDQVTDILRDFPEVLQMHGFYIDEVDKDIRFDVIMSFETKGKGKILKAIQEKLLEKYPGYSVRLTLDYDMSD